MIQRQFFMMRRLRSPVAGIGRCRAPGSPGPGYNEGELCEPFSLLPPFGIGTFGVEC